MISTIKWDSSFFNKKIGRLEISYESVNQIETALKKAIKEDFKYIICKLNTHHIPQSMNLELSGFYLSDIGITWAIQTEKFIYSPFNQNNTTIRTATDIDVPSIIEMARPLFGESRFYNDPFFTKEDADRLYNVWIENSVKGDAADIVFYIHKKGFITCKKRSADRGDIILIGIALNHRGKSYGSMLIKEALKWFQTNGITQVSVRTQLKNLNAMNFYSKLGFYIKEYDLVYAKIL